MSNVTFTLQLYQDKADTDAANSTIDVKVDGATVSSGTAITSTDENSPTEVSFTISDLSEASHTMEISFTNAYYVDSTDYRKITLLPSSYYVTAFDTFKDGIQKTYQDLYPDFDTTTTDKYYLRKRWFMSSWTAAAKDGAAIPNSGDTEWAENSHYIYDGSLNITFTYADNNYNIKPYRNVKDASSSPPTLSTTVQVPWDSSETWVMDPGSKADASKVQFAAE